MKSFCSAMYDNGKFNALVSDCTVKNWECLLVLLIMENILYELYLEILWVISYSRKNVITMKCIFDWSNYVNKRDMETINTQFVMIRIVYVKYFLRIANDHIAEELCQICC